MKELDRYDDYFDVELFKTEIKIEIDPVSRFTSSIFNIQWKQDKFVNKNNIAEFFKIISPLNQ